MNSPKGLKGPCDGLITGHVIGVNTSGVLLFTALMNLVAKYQIITVPAA